MHSEDFSKKFLTSKYYILLAAILLLGLFPSITAVLFRSGVHNLEILRLRLLEFLPAKYVLPLLGIFGGFISSIIITKFEPAASGSGISHLVGYLHDRKIPLNLKVAIVKLISGVIAIGSGFPLGGEGPSVHMGGAVAWQISKWLKAPKKFTKLLVATGGGAGLAAVFSAPIAGFTFVIEELLMTSKPIVFLFIALTAFVANSFGSILNSFGLDNESIRFSFAQGFMIDPHHDPFIKFFPLDTLYLVILGILVAIVGEIYIRYLLKIKSKSSEIFKHNYILKMTICGGFIGVIYSILPEVFHEFTELDNLIIDGKASAVIGSQTFLIMFFTTGIAVAAGAPGGLFMPMITLGASLGLAFLGISESITGYAPTSLVFAGIGAFISGCSRTPLTAIFIVLALTHNNLLLTPVLICCSTSFFISKLLNNNSFYERQLGKKLMGEQN